MRHWLQALFIGLIIVCVNIVVVNAKSNAPSAVTTRAATFAACDDSWQIVAQRHVYGLAELNDIVAIAPSNIWAVGSNSLNDERYKQALIMHSNGTTWEAISLPTISADVVQLYGIAAINANDIWAVGNAIVSISSIDTVIEAVILHWDGTHWVRVASPKGVISSTLFSIDARSANDVWAVGDDGNQPFLIHWNGTSWLRAANPPEASAFMRRIRGVSIVAANDVWAVGSTISSSVFTTFTLHWNGANWAVVPSPNISPGDIGELNAVDARAANDVWAVGSDSTTPIVLHWDGMSWAIQPAPTVDIGENILLDVLVLDQNNVWVVGESASQLLAMYWNGHEWYNTIPAQISSTYAGLYAIAATSPTDIWAVEHDTSQRSNTAIVRHFAPRVAFTNTTFERSAPASASISVQLTSTTPYTVSVDYSSSDGTAKAGIDYIATSGRLTVPPCNTRASATVSLLNNPLWRPAAYANLTLQNSVGAALGLPATARLFTANKAQAPIGRIVSIPVANAIPSRPPRIAYTVISQQLQNWDIYTMNADGTDRRQLTTFSGRDYQPSWSPDGKRLVFVSERNGNPEIYVMNADGSNQTRLTVSPAQDVTPVWSPDGKQIAFSSNRKGQFLLFIMQANGQGITQLTFPDTGYDPRDLTPSWSPDGQRIAFSSLRDASGWVDIFTVNVNTHVLQRLTSNSEDNTEPVWSPNGHTIAFTRYHQLMIMNTDGSQQRLLNPNFDTGSHPSWSPDGRVVAFTGLIGQIGFTDLSGTMPVLLSPPSYPESDPVWAPR
ncbi:MAG: Calx-beta domain-containing protein [Candidatus Saccharimonadales bacterium]